MFGGFCFPSVEEEEDCPSRLNRGAGFPSLVPFRDDSAGDDGGGLDKTIHNLEEQVEDGTECSKFWRPAEGTNATTDNEPGPAVLARNMDRNVAAVAMMKGRESLALFIMGFVVLVVSLSGPREQ